MLRNFVIMGTSKPEEMPDALGDKHKAHIDFLVGCEFGLAEEVVLLIYYKHGYWQVGIGECLRPWDRRYFGKDAEQASKVFHRTITRLAH